MAHSHDRTLLASLGFADPDKHEQMYDLGCEYLSQPTQARRIVELFEPAVENVRTVTEPSKTEQF